MSTKQQLQEILEECANYEIGFYNGSTSPQGLDISEATQAILDLLDKSVASVELADTYDIEGGEDPYDAYEMGFDRGLADVRKVIKEEA